MLWLLWLAFHRSGVSKSSQFHASSGVRPLPLTSCGPAWDCCLLALRPRSTGSSAQLSTWLYYGGRKELASKYLAPGWTMARLNRVGICNWGLLLASLHPLTVKLQSTPNNGYQSCFISFPLRVSASASKTHFVFSAWFSINLSLVGDQNQETGWPWASYSPFLGLSFLICKMCELNSFTEVSTVVTLGQVTIKKPSWFVALLLLLSPIQSTTNMVASPTWGLFKTQIRSYYSPALNKMQTPC